MRRLTIRCCLLLAATVSGCSSRATSTQKEGEPPTGFVTVEGGKLMLDGVPFYFAGTNQYALCYLQAMVPGFVESRMDLFVNNNIRVVRLFLHRDGEDCDPPQGAPVIQTAPGQY